MTDHDSQDYDNEYDDSDCWNCGGEGYVADCQDEIGCIDPESGCDFCIRRCPICRARAALSDPSALEEQKP